MEGEKMRSIFVLHIPSEAVEPRPSESNRRPRRRGQGSNINLLVEMPQRDQQKQYPKNHSGRINKRKMIASANQHCENAYVAWLFSVRRLVCIGERWCWRSIPLSKVSTWHGPVATDANTSSSGCSMGQIGSTAWEHDWWERPTDACGWMSPEWNGYCVSSIIDNINIILKYCNRIVHRKNEKNKKRRE